MKKFKSESEFTRWFCDQLRAVNAEVITFVGSKMQQSGIPDRYVCHKLFRGWLEMKKNNAKLRTNQRILMTRLNKRDDVCLVVRYRDDRIEIEDPATGEQLVEPMDVATATGNVIIISLMNAASRQEG